MTIISGIALVIISTSLYLYDKVVVESERREKEANGWELVR